jgi:hypothetical protein
MAGQRGWMVLSETVSAGWVNRLLNERVPAAYELLAEPTPRHIAGATRPAGMGGIAFTAPSPERSLGLRDSLARAVPDGRLNRHLTGLRRG